MSESPYRRLSPLTPVARGGIFVVAAAVTLWDDVLRGDLGPLALAFVGLLVAGAVFGFASWYRTKFWVEADELRVDTGVISHQSRRIRIDRLQGIDIAQPFVARLLGLAELRMDVAGGSDREGSLAFLTLADARELKDMLLARRDAARAETAGEQAGEWPGGQAGGQRQAPGGVADAPPVPERELARVDVGLLLQSLLLSPEAVAFALVIVLLVLGSLLSGDMGGVSVSVPLVGGLALVLFRRFAGNYRFTVSEGPAGLQTRRGLFDLNTQTIALPRLQGVVISEPVLWRMFGWARLDVSIAGYATGSGESEGASSSTVLPVGDRALVLRLARHVLGGVDPGTVSLTPVPDRAKWATPVWWRFMAAGATEQLVVTREGWLTRRTHVVPHARIQSLRLVQGPWQKRLGLADLEIDSPPGPVHARARHRPAADARRALEVEIEVSRDARQARQGVSGAKPG